MADSKKMLQTVLLVSGIVLIVLSLLIDAIGLGVDPRFGWKQTTMLIVGIVLVASRFCCCKSKCE